MNSANQFGNKYDSLEWMLASTGVLWNRVLRLVSLPSRLARPVRTR